jgi:YHS domain-containing protein
MNGKIKKFKTMLLLAGFLLVGLMVLGGCKKSEPAAPPESEEVASAEIEQTICPVMEGAINKNLFTEYKGKKVYFCCASCKEKFEKEPEKYLDKLPQFKK